jgi:hypothetical protein
VVRQHLELCLLGFAPPPKRLQSQADLGAYSRRGQELLGALEFREGGSVVPASPKIKPAADVLFRRVSRGRLGAGGGGGDDEMQPEAAGQQRAP